MAYCSKCGAKLPKGSKFCAKCGGKVITEEKPQQTQTTENKTEPVSNTRSGSSGALIAVIIVLVVLVLGGLFGLAFLGAKGQPGTIIKPSNVKTPQTLAASGVDKAIQLNWKSSGSKNVTKYNIYKSKKSADGFELLTTSNNISNLAYTDKDVKKGTTYYYVVTAVSADGTESGNSNQASYALQADPIVPKGITSWQDVLKKYDADKKYADVFKKVTGLTRSDIERYVALEAQGKNMKTKLLKGSIITNTTKNYVILYNYKLPADKEFLTDEYGNPYVMMWCGNPVKLVSKVTTLAKFAQSVQQTFYNIIYVFPAPVTNIFIYASQPISSVITTIAPGTFGPTMLPDGVLVDTIEDMGLATEPPEETSSPEPTSTLDEGQQWAVEGELYLEADPHDPAEYEQVTMYINLTSAQEGVSVEYTVEGTDGYTDSGTLTTNFEGEASFTIPGGEIGVTDTIHVNVPSLGLSGSAHYTF